MQNFSLCGQKTASQKFKKLPEFHIPRFPSSDWDWVICSALRELGTTEWEKYMNDSSLEKIVPSSKYLFVKCTDDKNKRDKYLNEMLKSNSNVSKDSATEVLQSFIESNSQNFAYILQYFNDHLETIRKL